MTNSQGDTNIRIEKNQEIPPEVKAKMERRSLPKSLHQTFLDMEEGDTIFLRSDMPRRTVNALRASINRFYDKSGRDFRFVPHEQDDGVRVYKLKNEA